MRKCNRCHTDDLLDSIELCSSQLALAYLQKIPFFWREIRMVRSQCGLHLAMSTRTKRPGLLLNVDTPCATSFVIGPFRQRVEKGGWHVKFSTTRFLRLF